MSIDKVTELYTIFKHLKKNAFLSECFQADHSNLIWNTSRWMKTYTSELSQSF